MSYRNPDYKEPFFASDIIKHPYGNTHWLVLGRTSYRFGDGNVACFNLMCLEDGSIKRFHESDINYFEVIA